jgi:ATP-binding cassette, subfamily C, bacterial CydC
MKIMLRLLNLTMKEPMFILFSAFLGFLTIGSSIGLIAVSSFLISDAALRVPIADLMVAIVGVRFFGISRAVFRYAERYFTHATTFKILSKIRVWFYNKLEILVPGAVDEVHNGDLFSRMVNDVEGLKEFYLRVINPPLVVVFILIFMCFVLNLVNSMLAISFIIFFLVGGLVIPYIIGVANRKSIKKMSEIKAAISISMMESLFGITEILVFELQTSFAKKMDKLSSKLMKFQLQSGILKGLSNATISILGNLCMWVSLLICIPMVRNGALKGDLLAVLALGIASSFEAIQPMGMLFTKLDESHVAASRLFEITDRKAAVCFSENNLKQPESNNIIIKDLCVRYSVDSKFAIRNINMKLTSGKKIAIVGPNGSGKSTLVNVLMGLKEFESGKIIVGDTDIKELNSDILMDRFSIVPQNPYLFNSTILENLRLASLEATDELIINCLKAAQINDFISTLPMGLNTFIGEDGLKLSGGQRQRLAIARALLRDKPVLILDEPSTGLDPVTEGKLLASLKEVWHKKSVLLITHKFFGLEEMDEILVLKKGQVIETGNHLNLMQYRGAYWNMWQEEKVGTNC